MPAPVALTVSYDTLLAELGEQLFGIVTGFGSEQTRQIERCMEHGLNDVYSAHPWSFFRPVEDITTTAPYATGTVTIASGVVTLAGGTFPSWAATGILKISNAYYSVSTRDSGTQLTLEDTSVTAAAGTAFQLARPEIDLPDAFEAVSDDSDLNYFPDQNVCYPPVCQRSDKAIRLWQQRDPYYWRPMYYSVRTVEFDPTVGSRKRLALYPTPDAAYVLRVPMILRPTMIDATNKYPVGGETLSQLITEACLAAAERNYDEQEGRHTQRFAQMLPLAIMADLEKSSPTSLGPDMPKGERHRHPGYDYETWRSSLIGEISLDGDVL